MSTFSVVECRRGFDAALENARRFYRDAIYLEENGRLLSATLLAIYAYDELGKALLTARAAMRPDKTPETWTQFRKDFRHHDPKIKAAQEFLNLCQGAFLFGSENLQRIVKELAERELELRKKVAFVELTNDNRFQMPSPDFHADCQRFMKKIKSVFTFFDDMLPLIYQRFDNAVTSTGSA